MNFQAIPFILIIIWIHIREIQPKIHPFLEKYDIYNKINNWIETKMNNRLILLYVVLALATLGCFLPPTLTWVLSLYKLNTPPFSIIDSTEWITIVSLLFSTYFGVEHLNTRVAMKNNINNIKKPSDLITKISSDNDNNDDGQEDLKHSLTHDQ